MIRDKKWLRLRAFAVAVLMVVSICSVGSFDLTAKAGTTTYQASDAFDASPGTQGQDGWYYQEWNGSSYSNLTWDSGNQRWQGSQTYLRITRTTLHPESSYDAVRKWEVPALGSARIRGNVAKNDTGGGDGVVVKIMLNSTVIWGPYTIAYNDTTGLNYDFTENVGPGDVLYFIVSKNSAIAYDLTNWDPIIDLTTTSAAPVTYHASDSFSDGLGIQGKDLWYNQQWNGSSYTNLAWDNTNTMWQGSQTYLRITSANMHPESSYDAVRKWVAPSDGYARIYGNVRKNDTTGGDGVVVKIMQNSTAVWGSYTIAYNDSTGLNHDFNRRVKAGDAVYFIVNKNSSINYDLTTWDPYIDFTPLSSGTTIVPWDYTSGANGWTAYNNCSVSASSGYLGVTVTGSHPAIISPDNINIDITKSCIIKIKCRNSTSSSSGAIYFTTTDDTTFKVEKALGFALNPSDANYTEYTVNMAGVYGWVNKLKRIYIDFGNASSGSVSVDYIKILSGGAGTPDFSLLDKEVVYDNYKIETVLGYNYYPDCCLGVVKNSDKSYKFFTSDGGATQCSTISSGTLEDPAYSIIGHRVSIANTPADFGYVATGPVYQDPSDANTIMSFVHLERHYTYQSVQYFYASIGVAITRNGGSTWTWCGEIIQPNAAYSATRALSLDAGAGKYIIQNVGGTDYFYVYTIDHASANPGWGAVSVARAPVADVLAAAKNNTVTSWYKYYNGAWTQPGMNGNFTNIFHPNISANFMAVSYNSYLNKYLFVFTYAYSYGTNYTDMALRISDSPTDFYNNTTEVIIDTSTEYTQYPTIIGLGNSDPETETQKNFYVYYTQWANDTHWSSDTNLCRKMVILD